MKISICDVCYNEGNKPLNERPMIRSKYRISYKDGKGKRISPDVCEKHGNFFKVCKSFAEAEKKWMVLVIA